MELNSTMEDHRRAQPLGAATPATPATPATSASAPHTQLASLDELGESLDDVFESVELLAQRANGFLERQAEERPQVVLACAAGLGFVLGGGLSSRIGTMLTRTGANLVLAHFMQRRSETGG